MFTSRVVRIQPEIPLGAKLFFKINKKVYVKVASDGFLSKWKSENGAYMLGSDEHLSHSRSFELVDKKAEVA